MTLGTLLVLAIIALIAVYTIRSLWKNRGKGACSSCHNAKHCCAHCEGCSPSITSDTHPRDE
jgi:hypothetical protein